MQKDIHSDDGSAAALYMLQKSMDEKDPRRKKELYDMFRVGLDTLDLDPILYEVLGMNRNSMGHWLPALVEGKCACMETKRSPGTGGIFIVHPSPDRQDGILFLSATYIWCRNNK